MQILPLHTLHNHIFLELAGNLWLIDTGAPSSFGAFNTLSIDDEQFELPATYGTLNAETLSDFVGVQCVGLLGADVLGRFDHVFDPIAGTLTVSTTESTHSGPVVPLDDFMGIPILNARVGDTDHRMFFDTGAQISCFEDHSLVSFPAAGTVTDFYPGVGHFQTDTHNVPVSLAGVPFALRCGALPGILGPTLMIAEVKGIVANSILANRIVGYFPRRRMMVL